jgi:hypothetical protein
MIYSRFGSEVRQVLSFNEESMTLTVVFQGDDEPEHVSVADLKADEGITEIIERGKAANELSNS